MFFKKRYITIIFILSITCNCQSQINDSDFLIKFPELSEIPSSNSILEQLIVTSSDTISHEILKTVFLIPINEINYSEKFFEKKYYYGGKYKLDSTHYLIVYRVNYDLHALKIVFSIYDIVSEKILSSMIISDVSGCIQRYSSFKNGIFTISNRYICIPNGLDPNPDNEFIEKNILEKYFINKNFLFEKIAD